MNRRLVFAFRPLVTLCSRQRRCSGEARRSRAPMLTAFAARRRFAATSDATAAAPEQTKPLCHCLKPAVLIAVKKTDSPNFGRNFWGCATHGTHGCSFLQWEFATSNVTHTVQDGPECHCGIKTVKLQVSKPGPNKGRFFYRCYNGLHKFDTTNNTACDYFQFTDDPRPDNANGPHCDCGKPSALMRVYKAGPNVGRQFYKCAQRESCSFFKWYK